MKLVIPLLAMLALGCASAKPIKTSDELARSMGEKVTVTGRYDVGRAGETVDAGAFTVALDREGGNNPPVGAIINATGVVARGAMSLGVFIDEIALKGMRNQKAVEARNVPPTGYVLRHASLQVIDAAPDPVNRPPSAEAGK